ncbi:MAG TPA: caspase family protein [Xanthobacteraceae bacterium]|nr:caspase family protein [Xanthobacteraceae bacterium]
MKKLLSLVAVAAAIAFAVIGGSVGAWAERRVALVVGNSNYKSPGISLPNPRNDAEDVSAVLKTLGFEVKTTVDASKRDMDLALADFARRATDADAALFFYAGHAMQFQGRNYLMPTDAELEDEISVRYQMVGLQDVTAALDRANGVKIMILDACRNNPLANRLQGALRGLSSPTRGLARIDKTQGMVVAYATAADEVAQDGQGRNSPFTAALLKRLQEPGLEIEMMFRRVAADVNAQTGGRQRPETTISLLSEYYLNQNDRIVFERMNKDDRTALRDFIARYPSSPLVNNALHQLDVLERIAREREEERRKADEEARRKAAEAAAAEARRRAEEAAAAEARRKADEAEAERKAAEAAEAKRKADEAAAAEARRTADEAEARRKAAEAAEAKRKADEAAAAEAKRRADEAAAAEARRRADEVAEAKRKADEADAKRKADERVANLEQKPDVPPASAPAPVTTAPGLAEPPAAKANRPEQIREVQAELRRLGCFEGKPDGQLNEATRNAVEAWWKHTARKTVVEINITDEFIKELKQQRREICPPERKPAPPVASRPPRTKDAAATSRPAEPVPSATAPKPPAVVAGPSRPAAPATAPRSPNATGIGF